MSYSSSLGATPRPGAARIRRVSPSTTRPRARSRSTAAHRRSGGEYHWTLVGTNTGPGGTGNRVRISGFEEWTIGDDGLVAESQGHFDQAEYDPQLEHGVEGP